jgi:hypothetical protein
MEKSLSWEANNRSAGQEIPIFDGTQSFTDAFNV